MSLYRRTAKQNNPQNDPAPVSSTSQSHIQPTAIESAPIPVQIAPPRAIPSEPTNLPSFAEIRAAQSPSANVILVNHNAANQLRNLLKHIDSSILTICLAPQYLLFSSEAATTSSYQQRHLVNHRCFFDIQMSLRVSCIIHSYVKHGLEPHLLPQRIQLFLGADQPIKVVFLFIEESVRKSSVSLSHHLNAINILCIANNIQLVPFFEWFELARYIEAFTLLEKYSDCGTRNLHIFDCISKDSAIIKMVNAGNLNNQNSSNIAVHLSAPQKAAFNALQALPGFSSSTIFALLTYFGTMQQFGSAKKEDLKDVTSIGDVRGDAILQLLDLPFSEVLKNKEANRR